MNVSASGYNRDVLEGEHYGRHRRRIVAVTDCDATCACSSAILKRSQMIAPTKGTAVNPSAS
jgi:hypothetical protein